MFPFPGNLAFDIRAPIDGACSATAPIGYATLRLKRSHA
jgi:hypothetical protein